jgi:Cu(I)/Ag(I) efflux system membrane fusion protein
MLSIVDLTQVWVKAEIFERDVFNVAMGDSATMRLDYLPAKQWQGSVEHIHPMLNPTTRTGIVRLHFDNYNGDLKPNMFAQISIVTRNNKPALQVPREALIHTGNQDRVVLALGDGYFKSIAVKVGRSDRDHIEILSGLSVGEKVVSSAQFLLDSESSKTSDFKRMDAEQHQHHMTEEMMHEENEQESVSSATVHGTVSSAMVNHRMVTIDREAIKKWNREPATVDFIVDEKVDMSLFTVDAYLMFTFEIHQGEFIIVSAMTMGKGMSHSMHEGHMSKKTALKGEAQ